MSTILDTIAAYAKVRVAQDKEATPLEQIKETAFRKAGISEEMMRKGAVETFKKDPFPEDNLFYRNIKKPGIRFICEIKKASPSKGIIAEEFPYVEIAKEYEAAGADCVSCLTEPKWFLGSDQIFTEIRKSVKTPMIRKDFVVDEYQIYQAKVMESNAILLICAILDKDTIAKYLDICHSLGMVAIVETHDDKGIREAVEAGAKIIGVNNRNLKDFTVDIDNSQKLRSLVPGDILFVAESGIKTPEDIKALKEARVDAVLIGETLMRAKDKTMMLKKLRGED